MANKKKIETKCFFMIFHLCVLLKLVAEYRFNQCRFPPGFLDSADAVNRFALNGFAFQCVPESLQVFFAILCVSASLREIFCFLEKLVTLGILPAGFESHYSVFGISKTGSWIPVTTPCRLRKYTLLAAPPASEETS
jgi:hypothetical protein